MSISAIRIKTKQFINKHILRHEIKQGLFYTGGRLNLGDSMVPWLVKQCTPIQLNYSNPLETRGEHLFVIGSILQYAGDNCTVWGSGFISEKSRLRGDKNINVCAVRGPLTQKILLNKHGIHVDVLGDPALLTPLFIKVTEPLKKYKFGIIPHYVDKRHLDYTWCEKNNVKVIDIETDDVVSFVRDINECEVIISSTLHGIIISESYGIPVVWVKFSDDVVGKDFKFMDYYLSTGRVSKPVNFSDLNLDSVQTGKMINTNDLHILQQRLLDAFPKKFS